MNQNCLNLKARYSELIKLQQELNLVILENKDRKLGKQIEKQIKEKIDIIEKSLPGLILKKEWQSFYRRIGWEGELDFSKVIIPKRTPEQEKEFVDLLIIPKGLTNQLVFEIMRKIFLGSANMCEAGELINDRNAEQSYAVWVRENVSSNYIHQNKSAEQLQKDGVKGITYLEALVLALKRFPSARLNMFCSGTRDDKNNVPFIFGIGEALAIDSCPSSEVKRDVFVCEVISN